MPGCGCGSQPIPRSWRVSFPTIDNGTCDDCTAMTTEFEIPLLADPNNCSLYQRPFRDSPKGRCNSLCVRHDWKQVRNHGFMSMPISVAYC